MPLVEPPSKDPSLTEHRVTELEAASSARSRARSASWRRWMREPLLHFLLFGVLVFTADAWLGEVEEPPRGEPSVGVAEVAPPVIRVDKALVEDLRRGRRALLEREPSDAEVAAAVQAWIDTEILVREALSRGLEVDDPVVRDHLARKMSFILDAREAAALPTEADLKALYEAHRGDYRLDTRLTLRQCFIAIGSQGAEASKARAEALLASAERGASLEALREASEQPPGGPVLRGRSLPRLVARYGEPFVEGLEALPLNTWTLRGSSLGWHVVRVEKRREGRQLTFEQARNRVVVRWKTIQTRQASEEALDALRRRYKVEGWPP